MRSFLESRGIELPEGGADDPPSTETIAGLGNRKNELVLKLIEEQGVEAYEGSVAYVQGGDRRRAAPRRRLLEHQLPARCSRRPGSLDLFEEIVDGHVAEREGLDGKPAPDTFLAGARLLGVEASEAAVFEDALAGVEAGRAGSFGFVVGVDRVGATPRRSPSTAPTSSSSDLAELLE